MVALRVIVGRVVVGAEVVDAVAKVVVAGSFDDVHPVGVARSPARPTKTARPEERKGRDRRIRGSLPTYRFGLLESGVVRTSLVMGGRQSARFTSPRSRTHL